MKWIIIGLALLALAGAGSSYLLYQSNSDLRVSNKEVKAQADKDVEAAAEVANGWKIAYADSKATQKQDDDLQAQLVTIGQDLRAQAAQSQGKYLTYLRSVSHDPQACENQPVPAALYDRLGLPTPGGQTGPAGPNGGVPPATRKPGIGLSGAKSP